MGDSFGVVKLLGTLALLLILANQIWPKAGKWARTRGIPRSTLKNPPPAKTAAEKKILKVINDIRTGPWMANVDTLHGRLVARIMTESVDARESWRSALPTATQAGGYAWAGNPPEVS